MIEVRIARAHERLEHGAIAVKRGAALGVGQHDTASAAHDVKHDRVDSRGGGRERGLDQKPAAGAAETELGELLGGHVDGARQRDLRTGKHLDRDSLCAQARVDLIDQPRDRDGVVGVAGVHVRCRHDRAHAGRARGPGERERALDRLGTVVDAR